MKRSLLLLTLPVAVLLGGCADAPMEPALHPEAVRAPILQPSADARFGVPFFLRVAHGVGGLSLAEATSAQAVIIDFESLASPGSSFTFVATYSEDGFTLVNETDPSSDFAFGSPQSGNADFYEGSAALVNNSYDGITVMTRDDGGTFGVRSIDLAELRPLGLSPRVVPFTGTRADGSTVSVTFTTDGIAGFQTFTFEGFSGLTSLSWVQIDPFHQFDDIALDPFDPQDKGDCSGGGWDRYGFKNQGQCVRFVETGKDSR